MIDIEGTHLSDADVVRLKHPLVGGVILFTRNYESIAQLQQLCEEIHALRAPQLLIAVDHEGGRVQRFREGFTRLPPMRALGIEWDRNPQHARHLAHALGFVLAAELRAHGVDLSFAPVLDIDHGSSSVIGDRSFHRERDAVAALAQSLVEGMGAAGMSAVGKHFPGHGHVLADSHHELPVDERPYSEIENDDLVPFVRLIESGLAAVMPAHIVYARVDEKPAGFSPVWLKQILREKLKFDGLVFSDDLSMEGAKAFGDIATRAGAALDAGCDMVLVCNEPQTVDELYRRMHRSMPAVSLARLARLHGRPAAESMIELREDARYVAALHAIAGLGDESGELPLA